MPINRKYGWAPDLPDYRDHLYSAPQPVLAKLPPKKDLRSGCPPVYDQGQLGSCTANAISGAIQFEQKKQGVTIFGPSRLFIYYNERDMEGTVNSDAGAQIRDGVKSVATLGVCPETEWPYDINKFVFGFTVYDAFESQEVAKTGVLNMPGPKEKVQGGHAVLAVGYDDATQRFTVRNSWGKDWGIKGYFTIPYTYLTTTDLADDFWTIRILKAS
jgi:C1A family cysteine protease